MIRGRNQGSFWHSKSNSSSQKGIFFLYRINLAKPLWIRQRLIKLLRIIMRDCTIQNVHPTRIYKPSFWMTLIFLVFQKKRETLDKDLTLLEISEAIDCMQAGKVAGSDSIPIDIYKRFKKKPTTNSSVGNVQRMSTG